MMTNKRSFTSKVRISVAAGLFSLGAAAAMMALAQGQSTTAATSAPSWTGPVQHAPVVLARDGHMVAYDEARGQIVLFGGFGCPDTSVTCDFLNDTWTWDGSSWTEQHPVTSPPGRSGASMAYDAARKKMVLFGGTAGGQVLNDTWTWDGANWAKETPPSSPPIRFAATMAYDAARREIVLFGGEKCSVIICKVRVGLNDTWVWDGTTWTQRAALTSPPPKTGATMAYDAVRSKIILFGGELTNQGGVSSDTWTWDGSIWTQQAPASSPPARTGATMAYDAADQTTVLYGGTDANDNYLGDTWTWDGAAWTRKLPPGPPARKWASMAYDAAHSKVVLFGGFFPDLNDTWTWDGSAWTEIQRTWPPARFTMAMAYDATRGNVVLLEEIRSGEVGETWTWDGTTWAQQHPAISPLGRGWDGVAYHAGTKRIVLFGGTNSQGVLGDTWTWDGTDWTEQHPPVSPPARYAHTMARDATGKLVMFGGGSTRALADTWTWDGITWTEQHPTNSPPLRAYASMAYNPNTGQTVLFGGYVRNPATGEAEAAGDTWIWDGINWIEQHPAVSPSPRIGPTMAYDPSTGQLMVFGGAASGNVNPGMSNEVWLWDGTTWNLQQPAGDGPPSPRWFVSLAEHPGTGAVVMFGGQIGNPGNPTDQTWIWKGAVSPTPTPTPTVTPMPTITPSPTPTGTPSATPAPTATPTPTATVTPTATPSPTATPTPTPAQLMNISTRLRVQTGDNVLIGGFIVTGSNIVTGNTPPKKVIVRAIGPSINVNGNPVPGRLDDPVLELHDASGAQIAFNDNWKDDPQQRAEIEFSGLAPGDDRESAIVRTLQPGAYTAIVRGKNNSTGIGLVEAYDRNPAANSKLANISTRGFVETGDNVMIGGFIAGNQSGPTKVVIRAIGPSLINSGVPNPLQDPMLELHDGNGAVFATNDNWQDDPGAAEIQSDKLAPNDARESATLQTLVPGAYSAIVRGKGDKVGVALVEIYNVR